MLANLLAVGVDRNKIDQQSNAMLLELWRQLRPEQQFTKCGKHPQQEIQVVHLEDYMVPMDVASHVLFHFEWSSCQCVNLKIPSGNQRPHVELAILCHRLMQRVMALVDSVAECSLIYSKPKQFPRPTAQIDSYGSQTVKVKAVSLPLEIGQLPVQSYTVKTVSLPLEIGQLPVQVYAVYVLPNPGIYLGDRCSTKA